MSKPANHPASRRVTPERVSMAGELVWQYFDIGLNQYHSIADVVRDDAGRVTGLKACHLPVILAAATMICLAIEINLRAIVGHQSREFPERREIAQLFELLPGQVKQAIARSYKHMSEEPPYNLLRFRIGKNQQPDGAEAVVRNDFELAMRSVSSMFVELRSFHEVFAPGSLRAIDFRWLCFIAEALMEVSSELRLGDE